MKRQNQKTARVAVALTDAEVLELGKQQSQLLGEYAKLEDARRAMSSLWNRAMDITRMIASRSRTVEVPVREVNDDEKRLVLSVRIDDPKQVVATRPMTPEEADAARKRQRQVRLPVVEDE